jgi:hypothetical protein
MSSREGMAGTEGGSVEEEEEEVGPPEPGGREEEWRAREGDEWFCWE